MVSYPLDFPSTLGIQNFSMKLRTAVARTESPFSYAEQVVKHSGEMWQIDAQLPYMGREKAEYYNAFLMKLRGRWGTFLIGDPAGYNPRGSWENTGSVLVKGAGQTGDQLVIDGFVAGRSGVVKAGDYFQLGTGTSSRLYKALDDADSNVSGEVTLTIAPTLRASPADNAALIFVNARGLFRLSENLQGWDIDPEGAGTYSIRFSAMEAL